MKLVFAPSQNETSPVVRLRPYNRNGRVQAATMQTDDVAVIRLSHLDKARRRAYPAQTVRGPRMAC